MAWNERAAFALAGRRRILPSNSRGLSVRSVFFGVPSLGSRLPASPLHEKWPHLHEKCVHLRSASRICTAWETAPMFAAWPRRRVRPGPGGPPSAGSVPCPRSSRGCIGGIGRIILPAIRGGIRLDQHRASLSGPKAEAGRVDGWRGHRPDSLREIEESISPTKKNELLDPRFPHRQRHAGAAPPIRAQGAYH